MLYLRLPVTIDCSGETLSGDIYLPSRMRGVSICVTRTRRTQKHQRLCETLGEIGMATLLLHATGEVSARRLVAAIDWVRTKRLLRNLAINLIATAADERAAERAAELRPVAVSAVLCTGAAQPLAVQHLHPLSRKRFAFA